MTAQLSQEETFLIRFDDLDFPFATTMEFGDLGLGDSELLIIAIDP